MIRFNKTEREIVRSIVNFSDKAESLADAINKSRLLEKRGWAVASKDDGEFYLFYRSDKYDYEDEQKVRGYLAELLALLEKLYNERLLVAFPSSHNRPLVIGREHVTRDRIDINKVDGGKEFIVLQQFGLRWYSQNKESLYNWCECTEMVRPLAAPIFSAYHVSQDLVELVDNNFQTEEDIRFRKQQIATWVSIILAFVIGIAGIIVSIIKG